MCQLQIVTGSATNRSYHFCDFEDIQVDVTNLFTRKVIECTDKISFIDLISHNFTQQLICSPGNRINKLTGGLFVSIVIWTQ